MLTSMAFVTQQQPGPGLLCYVRILGESQVVCEIPHPALEPVFSKHPWRFVRDKLQFWNTTEGR